MTDLLYDEQAESALLGAAFLDTTIFLNSIEASDLATPGYSELWGTCQNLVRQGIHPNIVTLPRGIFQEGVSPVTFIDACPSSVYYKDYSKIVKDYSKRRKLKIASSCFDNAANETDNQKRNELLQKGYELLQQSQASDETEIFTLKDAYKPRPPLEYAIKPIFAIPSLSIVYGIPGSMKSMIVADLCACVVSGVSWLSPLNQETSTDDLLSEVLSEGVTFQTTQAGVLWLDFDNGKRRTHERFEAMCKTRGIAEDAPFYYKSMPKEWLDAGNVEHIDRLIVEAKSLNVKVIVIDNLGVIKSCDENSPQMAGVMSGLRRLAESASCAVIVIHHQRKTNGHETRLGETLRGHSSIEASLDLALLVERKNETDETVEICSTKSRDTVIKSFAAQFHYSHKPGTNELETAYFEGVTIEGKAQKAKNAILETLEKQPGIKKGDLIATVQKQVSLGRDFVSKCFDDLETTTEQVRTEKGSHNATLCFLVS